LIPKPAGEHPLFGLFSRKNWRSLSEAFLLTVALQLTGISSILDYAPGIFEDAGFDNPLLPTVGIGVWQVGATVVAAAVLQLLRRPRLMVVFGLGVMCVSLAVLGVLKLALDPAQQAIPSIVCVFAFLSGFSVGPGSIFWVLLPAALPEAQRSFGVGLFNTLQWSWNIVLALVFPALTDAIGYGAIFLLFSGLSAFACLGLVTIYLIRVEQQQW
jgi:Sugar (and other) transporter